MKAKTKIPSKNPPNIPIITMPQSQPISENIRLGQALSEIESYSWIMFSCELVTKEFFSRLLTNRIDVRRLTTIKFAVCNNAVKSQLESHGVLAEYMPLSATAIKLAQGISARIHSREKLLFLRNYDDSPESTKDITAIFEKAGTAYDEVPIKCHLAVGQVGDKATS